MKRLSKVTFWGIHLVFLFVSLGELIRLPFGPANGILPNDLLLPILIVAWLFDKTLVERKFPKTSLWLPFLMFVAIAALSLGNSLHHLTPNEVITSGLYLIRFIEYFFLVFMVMDLSRGERTRQHLFRLMLGAALLLALLGFIQLKTYPDFEELAEIGWDPHINRLLSTWFDPNFLGGMLAFIMSFIAAKLINEPRIGGFMKGRLLSYGLFLLVALFLTYSRSGYLAFIASIGLIGLLRSRQLIIGALIASLLLISVSDRAQERVTNLLYSAKSLVTETSELPDATARLRIESWQNAWVIIQDHPFLGIGYNTYRYRQLDYGFVKDPSDHAATGSDSSLLTIWATTGSIGFFFYLWILWIALWGSFKKRRTALGLGFFAGLSGLLIHSIFVNSLLFSPMLVFIYTGFGLSLSEPSTNPE